MYLQWLHNDVRRNRIPASIKLKLFFPFVKFPFGKYVYLELTNKQTAGSKEYHACCKIGKTPGSNFGAENGCTDPGIARFYIVLPRRYPVATSYETTMASFHILNSSAIIRSLEDTHSRLLR